MARQVPQPGFRIAGWGSALPETIRTNSDVEEMLRAVDPAAFEAEPTNDRWIRKRTGIKERRLALRELGETTGSLATEAGRLALEAAGFKAGSIDMLVLATTSPDELMPATSVGVVQKNLGLENAFAYDLNAACSGFVFALAQTEAYMARHNLGRAMIIGADVLNQYTDETDRVTLPLFGAGGGAWVLESTPGQDRGMLGVSLKSSGNKEVLFCNHGGKIVMAKGRPVYEAGVKYMVETSQEAMAQAEVTPDEVHLVIPHQANERMDLAVIDELGIPREKLVLNVERIGNTSAASIPLAFGEKMQTIELESGQIIVIPAAGAGMTGGAVVLKV